MHVQNFVPIHLVDVADQLNNQPCHSQSHPNRTVCYRHTIPPYLWLFKVQYFINDGNVFLHSQICQQRID